VEDASYGTLEAMITKKSKRGSFSYSKIESGPCSTPTITEDFFPPDDKFIDDLWFHNGKLKCMHLSKESKFDLRGDFQTPES